MRLCLRMCRELSKVSCILLKRKLLLKVIRLTKCYENSENINHPQPLLSKEGRQNDDDADILGSIMGNFVGSIMASSM